LLVASSTLVEDVYVRLFRAKRSPGTLVALSRLATVAIASVAFVLAYSALRDWMQGSEGDSLIDGMVAYAWTGLGASFGPALLLALWWRGTTRTGALAGMLSGMTATVVWKNSATLGALLDMKAAAVLISAALVILVSLATRDSR
jgi:sodium/proline symporter